MLLFYVVLSVFVSFLCSMLEAVILSVTPSYLSALQKKNPTLYKRVRHLKINIDKPLASILTFNTIAHTIGAAGAGAEAQKLYGSEVLAVFSAALTFVILFFSEIIPKSIGASSWKLLLPFTSRILGPMVTISYPIVWLSQIVAKLFKGKAGQTISRDEIEAIADMGLMDGVIAKSEHRALKGLMTFRQIRAGEIVDAEKEVECLNINEPIENAYQKILNVPYSRLVVFGIDRHDIKGYVLKTSLLRAYIENKETPLKDLVSPMLISPSTVTVRSLFMKLLSRREHITAIIDEHGNFLGVLTLEDLIEKMLGLEIFDESDE